MTTQPLFPKPPRLATWLMDLFTPLEEESIVGDLFEEHSQLASKSGVKFARRWYWRQTAKTIAHMFGAGFRNAPWSTTATVVGGFLLLRLVSGLPNQLLNVITDRYLMFWSTHFQAYLWVTQRHAVGALDWHAVRWLCCGAGFQRKRNGRDDDAGLGSLRVGRLCFCMGWLARCRSVDRLCVGSMVVPA